MCVGPQIYVLNLISSKKRKASWLKDLVKEAKESVRPPRREVRESKALRDFPALGNM